MVKIIKSGVKKGFSLVEISIVMSIIGLLIGGVLAGQSLLNNQRRNAINTKANTLRTAYAQFKLKYSFAPGDHPTATQIWGRADGGSPVTNNCNNSETDIANLSGTCNGDGNGIITYPEDARAWQQLMHAGLIQGAYNGIPSYPPAIGASYPSSEASKYAFYQFFSNPYDDYCLDYTNVSSAQYNDLLYYGTFDGSCSVFGGGPALSPEDAYVLDRKIDDGIPYSGKVVTLESGSQANCVAGGQYNVSHDGDVCGLIYLK